MSPLGTLIEVASDWALAVVGILGSGLVGFVGYVRRVDSRSQTNKRRLEGDPDDPNNDGVLNIVSDNNRKIDHLEDKMDEQHSNLLERFEQLNDDE